MNVNKNDMITAAAAVTAGLGGAAVAGPVGAAVAGGAAAAVTNRSLNSDSSKSDEN